MIQTDRRTDGQTDGKRWNCLAACLETLATFYPIHSDYETLALVDTAARFRWLLVGVVSSSTGCREDDSFLSANILIDRGRTYSGLWRQEAVRPSAKQYCFAFSPPQTEQIRAPVAKVHFRFDRFYVQMTDRSQRLRFFPCGYLSLSPLATLWHLLSTDIDPVDSLKCCPALL